MKEILVLEISLPYPLFERTTKASWKAYFSSGLSVCLRYTFECCLSFVMLINGCWMLICFLILKFLETFVGIEVLL
jgi:hypothetical protein